MTESKERLRFLTS